MISNAMAVKQTGNAINDGNKAVKLKQNFTLDHYNI